MSRPNRMLALLLGTAMLAAACGGDDDDGSAAAQDPGDRTEEPGGICAPLESTETVTLGSSSTLSIGSSVQAQGNGYYEDENIEIKNESFASGQDVIALVGRGQLDAALGGLSANYFSAVSQGVEVWAVGSNGRLNPDDLASGFFVRSDLLDDGTVKEISDLKGLTVAFPGNYGGAAAYYSDLILQQGGLRITDMEQTPLAYADMPTAFENKSIDAAFVGSPFAAAIEEAGSGRRIGDQTVLAGEDVVAIFLGPNLLEDRPAVGCALLRANIRAAREALAPGANEREETVRAFVEVGEFPEELVRSTPDYLYDDTLELNPDSIERMQELFIEAGVLDLDEPLPYEEVVPVDFRAEVVASLDG